MAYADEIDRALAAHGAWKQRLLTVIQSGASEFTVAGVQVDNRCDFGKWFYGLPEAMRATPDAQSVRKLHAEFHQEAGRILGLALAGKKDEAASAIALGSKYAGLSGSLAISLGAWKRKLSNA